MTLKRSLMKCSCLVAAAAVAGPLALTATPGTAQAEETTLRAVMASSLRTLDPITTTAYVSRDHGYMIYDTLFATDSAFEVKPQMVGEYSYDEASLTYTFTLRDGLMFHDGEPVTTADVIPSIRRWGERDGLGQLTLSFISEMEAVDDDTFTITLTEPYGLVLAALGKPSSNVPFIMPERFASTPSTEALGPDQQIGSGPFRFVADEFDPGVVTVYEKNEDYVPRDEPLDWGTGGKTAGVDRVEWQVLPDHMTTVNALIAGEVDFMQTVPHDLLPLLDGNPDITVEITNTLGSAGMARLNHLHPPFDNKLIRQAAMYAMNGEDFLKAYPGIPEYYSVCLSLYPCDSPLASDIGTEPFASTNIEKAKELLEEAGYDGTPVLVMHPTDLVTLASFPPVAAQALRQAGFNVDIVTMDWQAVVARRAKQEPVAEGGWNMFITTWTGADIANPAAMSGLIASGREGGWFGWPEQPEIQELRTAFAKETDPAKQVEIAQRIQELAYDHVMYLNFGTFFAPAAWSSSLEGVQKAPFTSYWGITKN